MPDADVVPRERGPAGLLELPADVFQRDGVAPVPERAAARVGLYLEGAEADDVRAAREEGDEARDLVEVPVEDRRVEDDVEADAPHALDVLAPDGVQVFLGRVALPFLGQVDVDRDVGHPRLLQLDREVPRQLDSVRHQRGLEPQARGFADDRDELLAVPERRVAARDLHRDAVAVRRADAREALEDELDRNVLHLLRGLRQIAERAVQVAALRDLDRDAADGVPPPDGLRLDPQLRVEALERRREARAPTREIVEDRKRRHAEPPGARETRRGTAGIFLG